MKPSYLLVNVALIVVAIFIYDQLRSADATPTPLDDGSLLGSDTDDTPAPEGRPQPMRTGGLADRSRAALESRIANLEHILSSLQARRTTGQDGASPAAASGGTLPELAAIDLVDPEDPNYDEKTLRTIQSYMDEINRRKQVERQRSRVAAEIDRLGIDLSEAQQKTVVDQTLAFQGKARDLLRQGWPRDEDGRAARRQAFEKLQDDYKTTINRLVPTADAEKIAQSRVARGLGFFSGRNGRFGGGRASGVGASKKKRRKGDR